MSNNPLRAHGQSTLLDAKVAAGTSLFQPDFATITRKEKFTDLETFFEFKLDGGRDLNHRPGQFVEVSLFGIGEAPISVSSSPSQKGAFQMVIRNAGSVTNRIHAMNVGDRVGIRGPFGTCFPPERLAGRDLLFVCGGLGLVPARSLINWVIDHRKDFGRFILFYGARNPKEMLFREETAAWAKNKDIEYHVTVDRPDETWTGNKGVITTLFSKVKLDPARTSAIVVGPPVMYKFALIECKAKGIADDQIYMSLERRMKCGIGKCGHCQINSLYCCCDGPVFTYDQVKGFEEALR